MRGQGRHARPDPIDCIREYCAAGCGAQNGCTRRQYVTAADSDRVRAGPAEKRRVHPPTRPARELAAELRRLRRQVGNATADHLAKPSDDEPPIPAPPQAAETAVRHHV
jgi:hypothetical protein